jgi:hypothetical protein
MRKLLIAAVVLVLLGAGADFAAARIFEDRVTDALQREYDLGRRPVVQVRDVPFLPHLATGRFSTIDVAATDARAKGVNAAELQLTLHGVRVPREVMLGEPGRVTVEQADGTIELTEAEVNRLLADRLQGGKLAIKDDGVEVSADLALVGETLVKGKLGTRDGAVTFTPDEIRLGEQGRLDPAVENLLLDRFTFQVPLLELPAGVRLERVETRPGTLVLSGRAASVGVAT